jgi:translin
MPEELGVEYATYIRGLPRSSVNCADAAWDILRQGYSDEAERLLTFMDDIYAIW